MRIFILSSRDTLSNITFTLSFNVTFGPPSRVFCNYNNKVTILHNVRSDDHPNLLREVIKSQYVNSSQPDLTCVTIKVVQPIREERTYTCQVNVEGRINIVSGSYNYLQKGDGTTTVTVTGKCMLTTISPPLPHHPPSLSCRHPYWCHCQQDWLHLCAGLLDCPITTTSWL